MFLPPDDLEARNWADIPKLTTSTASISLGTRAIAEIKPHTDSGIRAGLDQLYKYRFGGNGLKPKYPNNPQWLVTYVALGPDNRPLRSGRATSVRIIARSVNWSGGKPTYGTFYDLGTPTIPSQIPFPRVDQPGFFGHAVEKYVRAQVFRRISERARRGSGGSRHGPDLKTHELADLYAELSRFTGDPLFAEISAELRHLTA